MRDSIPQPHPVDPATPAPAPYHHLLVPSDGSELSEAALGQALALAAHCGAHISVLHVRGNGPVPVVGMGEMLDPATLELLLEASRRDGERILARALALAEAAGVEARAEEVGGDAPHQAIVTMARTWGCDLIVMGSHGRRGLEGLLLGSETQRVLLKAPCPVLVVR